MNQKQFLAASVLLCVLPASSGALADASGEPSEERTPVSAQALPQLVIEKAEGDTFNSRHIFTELPADPFLFVNAKFKAGADALREETARRLKGGAAEDTDKPLVDLPPEGGATVQNAEASPKASSVLGDKLSVEGNAPLPVAKQPPSPVKVVLPTHDVIKPGTPVVINTTLQGAIQAQQAELAASKVPAADQVTKPDAVATAGAADAAETQPKPDVTVHVPTGGLQLGIPTDRSPAQGVTVPTDGSDLTVPAAQAYGLVPFEVLNPTTWRPAYEAYLAPHVSTNLALGLALAFVGIAFVLGRAAASSPLKKKK